MIEVHQIKHMLEQVGEESVVKFATGIDGTLTDLKFEGIAVERNFEINLDGQIENNKTKLTFILTHKEEN